MGFKHEFKVKHVLTQGSVLFFLIKMCCYKWLRGEEVKNRWVYKLQDETLKPVKDVGQAINYILCEGVQVYPVEGVLSPINGVVEATVLNVNHFLRLTVRLSFY